MVMGDGRAMLALLYLEDSEIYSAANRLNIGCEGALKRVPRSCRGRRPNVREAVDV